MNISANSSHGGVLYVTASGQEITFIYFQVCLLTIFVACWIIALNAIVVHTLMVRKPHSEVTDYFVSALSVADLLTGVVLLYVTAYSLLQFQVEWECLFRFGLTYLVSQASFTHILAITFDRYIKIIAPLKYLVIFTKKTAIGISISIWTVSIIIGLLPLLGWRKKLSQNSVVCRFFGVIPDGYFIFNFLFSVVVSVLMLFMYIHIIWVARRQRREMKALTETYSLRPQQMDAQTWALAKTVAIIVLISNLCWLPGVVVICLHLSGSLEGVGLEQRGDLITYTGLIVFSNSLLNPIIYTVKIPEVKKRFLMLLCCQKTRPSRGHSSHTNYTDELDVIEL